jgi:hypothetical protein
MENIKILIPTCDNYRNLLEANKYSMDRFGGEDLDVTVLGFKQPDFDMGKWKFVSMGNDMGANKFTNPLIEFFNDFDEEYFIYGNDDAVITSEINHDFLEEIINTIKNIENFGRIWLLNGSVNFYGVDKEIKDFGSYKILEIPQTTHYRLSLQYSIWKTSYFKKHLKANLSPWEWETRSDAINDNYAILIPENNYVFNVGHLMKRGRFINDWFKPIFNETSEFNTEDIRIMSNIFRKQKLLL